MHWKLPATRGRCRPIYCYCKDRKYKSSDIIRLFPIFPLACKVRLPRNIGKWKRYKFECFWKKSLMFVIKPAFIRSKMQKKTTTLWKIITILNNLIYFKMFFFFSSDAKLNSVSEFSHFNILIYYQCWEQFVGTCSFWEPAVFGNLRYFFSGFIDEKQNKNSIL